MLNNVYESLSQSFSNIIILNNNSLKILKETLQCEIQPKDLVNHVTVTYIIKNISKQMFNGNVYFVSSYLQENGFSLKINELKHPYQIITDRSLLNRHKNLFMQKADVLKEGKQFRSRYLLDSVEGKLFNLQVSPDEIKTVVVEFNQQKGYDLSRGGATYASMSHFSNLFRNKQSGQYVDYHYFLFPIQSFKAGIDELSISIKHPTQAAYPTEKDNARVDAFKANVPLNLVKENKDYKIYAATFQEVPADILAFGWDVNLYYKYGFTLTPYYYFNFTDNKHNFAFSIAADYIIKHEQVSIGALYSSDKQFQLFQEIKFFPRAHPY